MGEYEYSVIENGDVIARGMTLHNALTFVKAIFDESYNEPSLALTIQREDTHCIMVEDHAEVRDEF